MAEVTEQIVREAPEIEALRLGLIQSAKGLADKPITLPTQQVAGESPLTVQAQDLAATGIGGFEPYVTEGGFTLGDAATALTGVQSATEPYEIASRDALIAAINNAGLARGEFDPSGIAAFQNPFETAVVQQALADLQRQGDIAQLGVRAQAAGTGAFGGTRQAISEQELARNILDQQARTAGQLRAQGFQDAAQRAQQAFEAAKARELQAAQTTGQLASGLGSLGLDFGRLGIATGDALGTLGLRQASLGELRQQLEQREIAQLAELGLRQQAQQQAELEAQRQSSLAQLYEPYQRLSFLSDIYKGAPSTQQTIAAATAPNVSPAQQYLGLGIAGLSAAAGADRAGLFG